MRWKEVARATLGLAATLASVTLAQAAPTASGNVNLEPQGSGDPVTLTISYYGDAFGNVAGGVERGGTYLGRLGVLLDADLDRLLGWNGLVLHASAHQIHGTSVTPNRVDALNTVTGLEAERATRLNNVWIEQSFGGTVHVRVGQFTAAQEFLISNQAAMFVNSTFGWPTIAAQDLPSGGPAYPIATPGIRMSWTANKRTTALAAVFNGDPAGPGGGDPQRRDADGLNSLRLHGPPFLILEVQHSFGGTDDKPSTKLRLGTWIYLGETMDQRRTGEGTSLIDASGSGIPARRSVDYEVYAVIDQMLMAKAGAGSLAGFARTALSPSDRNLVDGYVDAGLVWSGPLPGRSYDSLGLAVGYAHVSPGPPRVAGMSASILPPRRGEAVIELSYQAKIINAWSIQPDLQYIIHPDGQLASAAASTARISNALVLGLRNILRF